MRVEKVPIAGHTRSWSYSSINMSTPASRKKTGMNASMCSGNRHCSWGPCPVHIRNKGRDSTRREKPRRVQQVAISGSDNRSGPGDHSGPGDRIGPDSRSGPGHSSRRTSPSRGDCYEDEGIPRRTITIPFMEHGTIPGMGAKDVPWTPTRLPLKMKPVPKASALETRAREIVPTVEIINTRPMGLEIHEEDMDTNVCTSQRLGPQRSYRRWKELQTATVSDRRNFRYQPPKIRTLAYVGGCITEDKRRTKLPESSDDVKHSKGDWLAEYESDRPILVFWDHVIREINNSLPQKKSDPEKYNVPQVDSDRLRWAWESFTPSGVPYVDISDRWHKGTGKCPFLLCNESSARYADDEFFARHLVEHHCKFSPRYYCGQEPHRGQAAGCHTASDPDSPFHTSRRHVFVDHLKSCHNIGTSVAIRTSEILAFGTECTKPYHKEFPRGQGMSWFLHREPHRDYGWLGTSTRCIYWHIPSMRDTLIPRRDHLLNLLPESYPNDVPPATTPREVIATTKCRYFPVDVVAPLPWHII